MVDKSKIDELVRLESEYRSEKLNLISNAQQKTKTEKAKLEDNIAALAESISIARQQLDKEIDKKELQNIVDTRIVEEKKNVDVNINKNLDQFKKESLNLLN